MLLRKEGARFSQKSVLGPQLHNFLLQLAESGALGHRERRLGLRIAIAMQLYPIPQCSLVDPQASRDLRDTAPRGQHLLDGLVTELGRELAALLRHNRTSMSDQTLSGLVSE